MSTKRLDSRRRAQHPSCAIGEKVSFVLCVGLEYIAFCLLKDIEKDVTAPILVCIVKNIQLINSTSELSDFGTATFTSRSFLIYHLTFLTSPSFSIPSQSSNTTTATAHTHTRTHARLVTQTCSPMCFPFVSPQNEARDGTTLCSLSIRNLFSRCGQLTYMKRKFAYAVTAVQES